MQYAHEKGIVHRDLKPANILFAGSEAVAGKDRPSPSKDSKASTKDPKPTEKDPKSSPDTGKSVGASKTSQSKAGQSFLSSRTSTSTGSLRASRVMPKVTDFGLAKRLEEDSGLTGSGTILGTPSYMAPEQASGQTKSVGPPADIHALGAILYEMLTGRPPFLGENVVETMNQVRTMDPVPPTRIQPKTPRDLETVCLKCLQKEMHKRYSTAGDLADDLHRFLHGEPIAARPVPVWEKGWKWAKRRPAQAALIALSVAVLVGAAVGGWTFAKIEKGLRDEADHQTEIARQELQHAEANFNSAREAADDLLVRVGSERLERVPKAEKLRRELLEKSLKFYDRFLNDHADNAAVRREAGWAYQRVGRIRNDLGDRKAAITAYEKAATLFQSLATVDGDRQTQDRLDLAQTRRQLAVVLEADGKTAQADAAYESARAGLRELADANIDNPAYRSQLADLLLNRGGQFYNRRKLTEAEDAFRQALAEYEQLCKVDPSAANRFARAKAQDNLGAVIFVAGRTEAAITELTKAVEGLTAVVRDVPDNPEYAKELGQAEFNLASAYFTAGKTEDAKRTYQQSVDELSRLATNFPNVEDYRFVLAVAHDNFAVFLKTTAGLRAAEPQRRAARVVYDELRREYPENLDYRLRYALDLDEHAIFLAENDRLDEAIAEEKVAVDLLGGIAAADPRNPEIGRVVRENARRHLNLGQLYARNRQADEADAEYALAIALLRGPADRRLRGDESWYDLPAVFLNQANLYQQLQRGKAAERSMREAVTVSRRIVAGTDHPDALAFLASGLQNLASLSTLKQAERLELAREAVERQRAALEHAPKRADLVVNLGLYGGYYITLLVDEGHHAAASTAASELARTIPQWPGLPMVAAQLGRCVRLARTDKALSDEQKAKLSTAYGDQALDLLQKAVAAGFKNAAVLKESADLEVLRTDPAFRDRFEKLLANMPK
jgi:tetratricopeptide (TPR) repeat protein